MPDDAHSITEVQLHDEARDLRAVAAAQKVLVGKQDRVAVVIAVAMPVILVILKTIWEPITPIAVLYAFAILLAFVLGLDRVRAPRLRAAARSREQHDCDVLNLPWNPRAAGEEPGPAEREEWKSAVAAAKGSGSQGRGDPFPREVDDLPLPYARLACQSLALYWEPSAVQRYVKALWLGAGVTVLVLLIAGLALHPTTETTATTLLALSPLVYWVWREQQRWQAAGRRAGRVLERLGSAWRNAMAGTIQAGTLPALARRIQDDIYAFRLQQPVIPQWAATRFWQRLSYDARRIDTFIDEFDQHRENA
jgi:hypothetical protein